MTYTKSIETVPQDVYDILNPDTHHEPSEEYLDKFCLNIKAQMRRILNKATEGDVLRFSALGKPDRQLWYEAHPDGSKEKLDGQTMMKFLYGHILEEVLLYLIKEAGHTVEMEQAVVEVDGVFGHIDATIDGVLVDVKSASPYAYKKFEEGRVVHDDTFGYTQQLSGYAENVTPDKAPAWVAMDKVAGKLCVSSLPVSVVKSYPVAPRVTHLREIISSDTPPEKCYQAEPDGKSGNLKLGVGCSYCPHKKRCWPGLRTFIYSTGPRFLTKVLRTPDVYEAT